jgi:hypothetical protein
VTVFHEVLSEQSPVTRSGRRRSPISSLPLRLPEVALISALGVFLVAEVFTGARREGEASPVAHLAYWFGQLLIVAPVVVRLFSSRARTRSDTIGLVLVLAVAEYLVKVCYSPTAFANPDELQHWRTATNILDLGTLFSPNYALPVSAEYPGLESVTAALVSVTGLPLFIAGLIVAGVAHLAFVALLFLLFDRVSGSSRLAGVAVVVYATNPHFASFDSLFVYGTLGLTFLAATLLVVHRLATGDVTASRPGWVVLGVLSVAATVVTHHISSFVLVFVLTLVAAATAVRQGVRAAAWPAAFAAVAAGLTALWMLVVAPDTLDYLRPTTIDRLGRLSWPFGANAEAVLQGRPLHHAAVGVVATAFMAVLLPVGCRQIWRMRRADGWAVAFAVASLGWYALVGLRLLFVDSTEIFGRASTYVYLPVGFVAAVALLHLAESVPRQPAGEVVAVCITIVIFISGMVNGWPPFWERLPGAYVPGGFERSVSPQGVEAARWAATDVEPGSRFAADLANYSLLGPYGDVEAIRDSGPLFRSDRLRPSDVAHIRRLAVRYVMTDRRLAELMPASGQYFSVDRLAGRYRGPLNAGAMEKFAHVPGVSRVYDGGDIKVYDLQGARYAR